MRLSRLLPAPLAVALVTFTPLLLLGVTIYRQFANMYTEKIREQISYRAEFQAEALDLFLKERTAILGTIADTHGFGWAWLLPATFAAVAAALLWTVSTRQGVEAR